MDDPALVILYSQLRQKTLQTLQGASKVTPKVEWEFVLHSARLYDRMGCDLLGLDIGESTFVLLRPCNSLMPLFEVDATVETDESRSTQLGVSSHWECNCPWPRRRSQSFEVVTA